MPLTRRRDATENLEQWSIYDEGVLVGLMRKVGATDGKTAWQWSCGMSELPHQPSGSAADFDEARAELQQAWDEIAHQVTPAMREEWLYHEAFTAWKYAMHDAGCQMPTQKPEGWSHCFCGARITTSGVPDHIRVAHMGTNRPPRT